MSSEGILFALLLLALVVGLTAAPLFTRAPAPVDALLDKQRARLQVYYERVLRNIRDLDEDYALGKIDESAYRTEREHWTERGVQVLKALDTLPQHRMIADSAAEDSAVDRAIDAAIEQAVEQYRAARIR